MRRAVTLTCRQPINAEDGTLYAETALDDDLWAMLTQEARAMGMDVNTAAKALIEREVRRQNMLRTTPESDLRTIPLLDMGQLSAIGRGQLARRHEHQPEDMALLAAAEPEPVSDEEVEAARRQSEPEPIHDLLRDVVADWRAKANEARTGACDLTPFCASHKLNGQADLLDQCADTLLAVLDGKEGR